MAFHESHERQCPHCGARMSATAPKCLNCGRYVDEEEDAAQAEAEGRTRMGWFIALAVVAVVIVLIVVLSLE
jgi:uncharacterized membrane protein YvbJ